MTLEQACPSEYQRAQCAFKDSMTHGNSAIRITYRISLRSSSMPEPRDPLLKVLFFVHYTINQFRRHGWVQDFLKGGRRRAKTLQRGGVHPPAVWEDRPAEATIGIIKQGVGRSDPGEQVLISVMILPQVHLRKPCYDFYFL